MKPNLKLSGAPVNTTNAPMTDAARASPSTEGLGLAFPERDYLAFDPFDGDRDGDVRLRTVKMARARKEHHCFGGADPRYGDKHTIKPVEVYRYERALIDGDYWGKYRMCVACMDKWLTEIGRTPASPNVKVSGAEPLFGEASVPPQG